MYKYIYNIYTRARAKQLICYCLTVPDAINRIQDVKMISITNIVAGNKIRLVVIYYLFDTAFV